MKENENQIYQNYCLHCSLFGSCLEACQKVELFINQDYVSQREVSLAPFLFDVMDSDIKSFFLEITSERQMSPKEKQKLQRRFHLTESQLTVIDLIFWQKKSQVEGGKNLGITQSGISRIIQAAKRKIHKRLRIKGNGK